MNFCADLGAGHAVYLNAEEPEHPNQQKYPGQ